LLIPSGVALVVVNTTASAALQSPVAWSADII
jgi:O-acetylhomoserine/O-acetylserine sulfhydrylase-like pyridoxal-dependent enzyme